MNKRTALVFITIIFVIIQTSFLNELLGQAVNPNLVASLVFFLVLSSNLRSAYVAAIVGGLFFDLISGGVIGLSAFSLTLFVWLYTILHSFYLRNRWTGLFFAAGYFYIIKFVLARALLFDGWVLVGAVLTAALGVLFSVLIKIDHEKTTL